MLQSLQTALLLTFPALVIVGGLRDAVSFTIPNWISLALLALYVPAALALGASPVQIGLSAAIGFAGLLMGMGMFAAGWIGGGDAKLFAVATLWMGWPAVLTFLAVTALAGGGLAMFLLALRSSRLRPLTARAGDGWFGRLATPGEGVPYGVAIAAGALIAFPQSGLAVLLPGLS